jgi:hypothetical protein
MKRTFLTMIVVAVALAAVSISPASGATRATDLPFKGSGSGTERVTSFGPPVTSVVDGTLLGTQIGKAAFHVENTNTVGTAFVGTRTITAANGDTIADTLSGSAVFTGPRTAIATIHDKIMGGTGRFTDATGTFTTTVTLAFDPSDLTVATATLTYHGTINLSR